MTILVNFRQTVGYRGDDGPDAYVETGINAYPYASGLGYTVGWVAPSGSFTYFNRTTGGDARLGGVVLMPSWTDNKYQIDLPSAGVYEIEAAFGDNATDQISLAHAIFRDNTTQFGSTVGPIDTAIQGFVDATSVEHAGGAAWVSSNARLTRTFVSTIFTTERVYGGNNVRIAHLGVYPVEGGPSSALPIFINHLTNQGLL